MSRWTRFKAWFKEDIKMAATGPGAAGDIARAIVRAKGWQ